MKWTIKTIIGLGLFTASCMEPWRAAIEKVSLSPVFHIDAQGWELVQAQDARDYEKTYTLRKIDSDTTKIVLISEWYDDSVALIQYKKSFPCHTMDTCFLQMDSRDTLFYYRTHNGKLVFEVGEYAYKFTSMTLKSSQLDYYLENADSLRKVRGTNLPELPVD
jgi:hypothetical protein